MLLTCENCETIFRIESAQLATAGQQVRCSVCHHVWAPDIEERTNPENEILRESLSVLRKPLMICALVIATFSLLSFNRTLITAYVPSLIPVFDVTGLTIRPDISKLEVTDLKANFLGDTLRIRGNLSNKSALMTHAAPLQLSILDEDGVVLHSQRLTPDDAFIPAGSATEFFIQLTIEDATQAEIRLEPLALRLTASRP